MARLENLIWPQTPSQESALKSVLVRRCGRSLTTQAPGAGQQKVPWDGVAVHPANVARRDPEDLVLRFPSVETRAKELILVLLAQVSIRSSLTFRSMKNKT